LLRGDALLIEHRNGKNRNESSKAIAFLRRCPAVCDACGTSPPRRERGGERCFPTAVYFGSSRPGARCETSWTIHALPSGSWKAT
jgi:hypothetical protein